VFMRRPLGLYLPRRGFSRICEMASGGKIRINRIV
jgi:hypothetical protein